MKKTVVLRVRMSESEYAEVKECAGFETVSSYCRRMLVGKKVGVIATESKDEAVGRRESKREKTCRHGKTKGYNCGMCGGMARVDA